MCSSIGDGCPLAGPSHPTHTIAANQIRMPASSLERMEQREGLECLAWPMSPREPIGRMSNETEATPRLLAKCSACGGVVAKSALPEIDGYDVAHAHALPFLIGFGRRGTISETGFGIVGGVAGGV